MVITFPRAAAPAALADVRHAVGSLKSRNAGSGTVRPFSPGRKYPGGELASGQEGAGPLAFAATTALIATGECT